MASIRRIVLNLVAGAVACVVAGGVHSAEVNVLASAAVKEAYLELLPAFETSTGHKVLARWSGTADIVKRVKGGETADLLILGSDSVDELIDLGKLEKGSRIDLVKSRVGVAVRSGTPKPDISSGDALKKTLVSAKSIAYSTGPSGVYLDALFKRMGIADELKPRLKQPPSGASVGQMVARGEADIGFQQVSELIHVAGVDYLGPLPSDVEHVTVYSSGIFAAAKERSAARELAMYLRSPAAAAAWRSHGMEPD